LLVADLFHTSVLLFFQTHVNIWEKLSKTVCHAQKEVSCSYVVQNVDGKIILVEKCGGLDQHFLPLSTDSVCKIKN